jgi:2-polyprenyl-6-methoxyphenol hydroxylase-like FAD-dependent oxidoreductase
LQDEVLILGGGVAGCAASIALARRGRGVTLIEREPTLRHKVCGEFLSGEALEDLHALGIDVASLDGRGKRQRSLRGAPGGEANVVDGHGVRRDVPARREIGQGRAVHGEVLRDLLLI